MKKNIIAALLCAVMVMLPLSSCAADTDPDGVGAGRVTASGDGGTVAAGVSTSDVGDGTSDAGSDTSDVGETADTDAPDDTTGEKESEGSDTPEAVTGYNIPTDLSFLDGIQKGHFSDKNPKDPNGCWYPGNTTRDLTTGEVTYNWDRAQDTLDLVDKYGAIYRGSDSEKYVYLTFDCGYEYRTAQGKYSVGVTNVILDVLKEKGVPGTFFVTGDYLTTDSDIVERMLDEGHIVGTHTMHHYNMTTLTPEKFVEEIRLNNELLKEKIPTAPDMTFYRPPEGGANEWTLALAQRMGLTTTFWSATIADYNTAEQPDPAEALQADKMMLHNGCVYLLHAVSTTNAEILGDLIDYIHAEGYEIRPLDQFVR